MKKLTYLLLLMVVLLGLTLPMNRLSHSAVLYFSAEETLPEPLDFSGMDLRDIGSLEQQLSEINGPQTVILRDCGLSEEQMMELADRWPEIQFVWDMELLGVLVSSDAEEIDLTGVPMEDTQAIESRLKYLKNVKKIIMTDCGLDNETMDALNQKYPEIRFVWTVKLGSLKVRTDETWFMPVKFNATVQTKDLVDFKYCTDMICVDIGHMWVDNCEWAAYMPNLEYLIIGETAITDLTPLSGLKKLKYLELFTIKVTDYTPLLGCTGLEDLNLGLTYGDPDVIAQMTWLKNLWWCDANGVHDQQRREAVTRMCETLKDTNIAIYIDHPTASGWRRLPNYYAMRDILGMFYLP